MLDNVAETSAEIAEISRRKQKFRDLYESVQYEISQAAQTGSNDASCKITDEEMEFLEDLIEALTSRDYKVSFSPEKKRLSISWEISESE